MIKLFDSELKVMDILWKGGDKTAKDMVKILNEQVGWSRTTTYTIVKKLVDKGVIERIEPGFICHPLITQEQAQKAEVDQLVDKMFEGSHGLLMSALLTREDLPEQVLEELKKMIEEAR